MKPKYESDEHLALLKDQLQTYLLNTIDPEVRDKRVRVIAKEYNFCDNSTLACSLMEWNDDKRKVPVYELQLHGYKIINFIEDSHLLGQNEVVVPHLVNEYSMLKNILTLLNEEFKRLNQFQELKDNVPKFDIKRLKSCLYDDLTHLKDNFNVDINIKEILSAV